MSQNDRFAKEAAARIKRAWRESRGRLGMASRGSIAAAEGALRARRRRRILVTWAVPALAASIAVGGVVLGWSSLARRSHRAAAPAPGVRALVFLGAAARGGSSPDPTRELAGGDQIFAPHTAAIAIGDAGGTQLTLEPGGNLTVLDAGAHRRFALRRGAVRVRVRKLIAGERFIIETADSEIEVHGTEFRVELGAPSLVPCAGPGPSDSIVTRVTVSEGVVTVKWSGEQQRLLPGDEWPPRCPPAAVWSPPAARTPAPVRSASRPVSARAVAAHRPPAPRSIEPASVLEAQNDLFLSAVRARRNGRAAQALALLNRYIGEYPQGSLFESALAQKMRLLTATADVPGATAAARQYLARFPDGFAREEARTLTGATTPP